MTVEELIAMLLTLPQTAMVFVDTHDLGPDDIASVDYDKGQVTIRLADDESKDAERNEE